MTISWRWRGSPRVRPQWARLIREEAPTPELPEVENIVRGLRPTLLGRSVAGVQVVWARTVAYPDVEQFCTQIVGRRVESVSRRGKYLVLGLDAGWLLVHLKMSGRLRWGSPDDPIGTYTRLVLDLDDEHQLRLDDPRKFGRVYLVRDAEQVTAKLGPEPLDDDFRPDDLRRSLSHRSGRLKSVLLDQHFLAGVGNIYADEVLFQARLHPLRPANSLDVDEQARLYESLRRILEQAIVGHGTTLDDGGYVDAEGDSGRYQEQIAVYAREGQPCRHCGTPIQRMVIGQRSSHFCPSCQPAP